MFQSSKTHLVKQYGAVIAINMSIVTFGMAIAWLSPMIVKLRSSNDTLLSRPITDDEVSWVVSASSLSNLVCNLLAAFSVDRFGRKTCMVLASVPKIAACLIYTFATEVWMLLLARVLDGLSESFVMVVVPVFTAEIASKEIRGALGTIFQICSSLGVIIMFGIGPYTSYKTMSVIYLGIAVIASTATLFLPESPYYLYAAGEEENAMKILTSLRGSTFRAGAEMKEYSLNRNEKIKKMTLYKDKVVLKSLGIAIFLGIAIQLTGFNAISYYLQTILESTHATISPEIASVIIGATQLFASICTFFILDSFGRKPVLMVTLLGVAVGMIGMGTFFEFKDEGKEIVGFLNFLPLISLILVVFCFSAGIGSIFWILTAELLDGPARAIGSSLSTLFSTLAQFFLTKYFIDFTSAVGPAITYWIFAASCLIISFLISILVPETKKKSLSEIQVALGKCR